MMGDPNLSAVQVGQAVYTWSQTLVDGTRGVGFSAVSPSLAGSIDWLRRLKLSEFRLFKEDSPATELYEARKGFSEVGRLVKGDISIVYCKTADGALDAHQRPQPVVHALFAPVNALDFLGSLHIHDELWIRQLESSAAGLRLPDLLVTEVITPGIAEHSCPDDHEYAEKFLEFIARNSIEDGEVVAISPGLKYLLGIALAFPADIVNNFSFTPFVGIPATRHDVQIRLPDAAKQDYWAAGRPATESKCTLQRAVLRGARRYLYVDDPSLRQYAEFVLAAKARPDDPDEMVAARETRQPSDVAAARASTSSVADALQAVRGPAAGGHLTDADSVRLMEILRRSGAVREILNEDPRVLQKAFGGVGDPDVIRQWNQEWSDLDAEVFSTLWNKTHIGMFLGIVLLRSLPSDGGPPVGQLKIAPSKGMAEDVTRSILLSTMSYPGGSVGLGHVIKSGLGDTEPMQKFISESFTEYPGYLYDEVLPSAGVSGSDMIGYIRFNYQEWARYRELKDAEAEALCALFNPRIMDFFRQFVRNRLPGHDD